MPSVWVWVGGKHNLKMFSRAFPHDKITFFVMIRSMTPKRHQRWQQPFTPQAEAVAAADPAPTCNWADCGAAGPYKAPVSARQPNAHHNFCLHHVRLYNASWNYWQGMAPAEVEARTRAALLGHRPTWPFGQQAFLRARERVAKDWQQWFDEAADGPAPHARPDPLAHLGPAIAQALRLFDLQPPVSAAALKQRYKTLVKQHHPDLHGEAQAEKLKAINQAYGVLKEHLASLG
jgi:hypothetical protein